MHSGVGVEKVLSTGSEGGGLTIYRRPVETGDGTESGRWVFWRGSSSMLLDENDDEVWNFSKSEAADKIEDVCPRHLFRLYPTYLHPQFAAWCRQALLLYRASWNDEVKGWQARRLKEWEQVIADALAAESSRDAS